MFWHDYDGHYLDIERMITPPIRILRDAGKATGGINTSNSSSFIERD